MAEKKKESTVPSFDAINFKNRDVMRWTEMSQNPTRSAVPVQVQGLATISSKTKLPRYSKK